MTRAIFRCTPLLLVLLPACTDTPTVPPSQAERSNENATALTSITVVMSNLNSPRGLAFGPEGGLYVAESGTREVTGPCAPVQRGLNCYSGTGAITRFWRGTQERIASGLPSVYLAALDDITGPHHLSFQGRGGMYVAVGWGGEPAARAGLGSAGRGLGSLLKVEPTGQWRDVADVAAHEQGHNPDGRLIDSNPYGVLAEPGRRFVTDAGGNTLLEVHANGTVSLVAVFAPITVPPGPFNPPFPDMEAVPTQVRRGPDGALYVSSLTGAPFLPGAAAIYRVPPGEPPVLYAGGFTQITDFDWDATGHLYVLQYASGPFLSGPGALIRVAPNGTRTVITAALTNPTGLAIGSGGALYVAHKHRIPAGGEVLRIVE